MQCSSSDDPREALIQRLLRRYEELLRRRLTSGPQTLEQIEREISEISSELNKISQEEKIADAVGLDVPHTFMCSNGHSAVLKSWNTCQTIDFASICRRGTHHAASSRVTPGQHHSPVFIQRR